MQKETLNLQLLLPAAAVVQTPSVVLPHSLIKKNLDLLQLKLVELVLELEKMLPA